MGTLGNAIVTFIYQLEHCTTELLSQWLQRDSRLALTTITGQFG